MVGHTDPDCRLIRVFQYDMATCAVMLEETGSIEGPQDDPRLKRGEPPPHAASNVTRSFSLTGFSLMVLSPGMRSPSLRKLSR